MMGLPLGEKMWEESVKIGEKALLGYNPGLLATIIATLVERSHSTKKSLSSNE